MDFIIRDFDAADLPMLQQIRAEAFAPVFQAFRELSGPDIAPVAFADAEAEQSKLLKDLCDEGSSWTLLVAALEERPVGFAAYSADAATGLGELGLNAVRPNFARCGIGTALYSEAIERMRAMGVKVAWVSTGGDASHAAARRAYEKIGFGHSIPSLCYYRLL